MSGTSGTCGIDQGGLNVWDIRHLMGEWIWGTGFGQ
jgi:hypothetical protein